MRASSPNSTSSAPASRAAAMPARMRCGVAGDVADRGVHLAESQPHVRASLSGQLCDGGSLLARAPWRPSAWRASVSLARGLRAGDLAVGALAAALLGAFARARRRLGSATRLAGVAGTPAARASEAIARSRSRAIASSSGSGVVVGEQAEAEMAVVAHHGDPERLAAGERHDRDRAPAAGGRAGTAGTAGRGRW